MNTLTVVTPVRTVTYTVVGEMPTSVGGIVVKEGVVTFSSTYCWGAGGIISHMLQMGRLIAPELTFQSVDT